MINDQPPNGPVWAAVLNGLAASSHSAVMRPAQKKCKCPRLHQLEHDIREICRRNPQGPQATQADRQRTLLMCARQWFRLGVHRKRAVNLNTDNIRMLVDAWHAEQLSAATMRNRLLYLRWLARKIGKPHIVAPSNRAYGAGRGEK
ncbi:phage integrase N-terminal domain-containing protein [Noviherbaspirillum saxi]|uniref:Putative integrase N-terminal domain-containing protein n=1 Tax=Noviherbaspirillum saxi TaxID=2320863 RepID=A0A3A3FHZ3_9BURK|nr:phage integrase N-terminal domain-containing protein [Noviherbaspirillum saxi]RJF95128.1 hypothetical protein D3871_16835 [Noviherbaspirillum saxi]